MSKTSNFQIAVDGPVSAGKGTVCRLVAERLGFLYIDTGAMYRLTGLITQRLGADPSQPSQYLTQLKAAHFDLRIPTDQEKDGRLITVLLDNEDVSWKIRTEEVGNLASKVAQLKEVRQILVKKQQEIAATQNVVMEGRDITSVVLPNADLKIFLTASSLVRAKRRLQQLQQKGEDTSFEEVHQDLLDRDKRDTQRDVDPLQVVPEAWLIDTSDLKIEQVVETIVNRVKAIRN